MLIFFPQSLHYLSYWFFSLYFLPHIPFFYACFFVLIPRHQFLLIAFRDLLFERCITSLSCVILSQLPLQVRVNSCIPLWLLFSLHQEQFTLRERIKLNKVTFPNQKLLRVYFHFTHFTVLATHHNRRSFYVNFYLSDYEIRRLRLCVFILFLT